MNIKINCLSAILGFFVYAVPVSADLLLSEDWEAEAVGDRIDQLEQWNARGGSGAIMRQGGNRFLRLDDPDPSNFSWVTYKTEFSFADGNKLSYASDITLQGTVDADAPAKLGIRRELSPALRYNVAIYPTRIELEELGVKNVILGSLAASVGRRPATHISVDHHASRRQYRLRRLHGRWTSVLRNRCDALSGHR